MVCGNHKNILPRNLFTYTLRKWKITKGDLCVRGFHVYRDIYTMLGSIPPYVSAISGAVVIVCSSPLPGCPLPALLESPERLLELVLRTKVSLFGPVSRIYTAGTAIEPLYLPSAVRLTILLNIYVYIYS